MSIDPAGRVLRSTGSPHSETPRPAPIRTFLHTDDGVTIDSVYDPPSFVYDASRSPARDLVFVIAHGFTGDVDRPHVRRVVRALTRYAGVVTFSFRGHGASGGRSTVGDREVLDLAAAVAWARELGHARVVTVGFSMGGSVVLRHAALYGRESGGGVDAVVSVSAPARWYYRGTAPMRRLHWLVTRPAGRLVSRYGFRTRIHHRDWDPVPLSPVEAVPRIAPAPLLIVHGDRDGYFPLDHPRMLAEAASDHAELWIEPMGHAEHAVGDELLGRIGDWAVTAGG
ncbi:alpha/beta fold hydrolase [Streptomyces sp. SAI-041]|uniref:alpha/beta hydrolase n=1 Tax=Streptomyces sp. SAI-041 TaxID=2940548 RepID=UPI002475BBC1|nr:alpha/beta fold hydrolase [Streptomyces sp. SAI-041]MDH6550360.1 pimeloyl-ACP methyl ester carboxylesterase [Streptomyces sp. SAI-041]